MSEEEGAWLAVVDFVCRDEDRLCVLDDFSLAEETGCEGEDVCGTDDFPVACGDEDSFDVVNDFLPVAEIR